MSAWKNLDIKNKIAYMTAITAFAIGWGLTITGFIIGAGVISDSVLWVLGQALIYAASVFGVGMYVGGEMNRLKSEIKMFAKNPDNEEIIEEL